MRTLRLSLGATVMMALGCVVAVVACSPGGLVLSDEVYERCRGHIQTGSAATIDYARGDHPVRAIPECIGELGLHVATEPKWSLEVTEQHALKPMEVDRDDVRLAIGYPFHLGPDGPTQDDLVPSFVVWALDVEDRSANTYVEDVAPELVQDWEILGTSFPKVSGSLFVEHGAKLASWQDIDGHDVYVVRWNPEYLDGLDELDEQDGSQLYDMAHYFYPADRVLFWVFRSGVPSDHDVLLEEVLSALPETSTLAAKPDRPAVAQSYPWGQMTDYQLTGVLGILGGLAMLAFFLAIILPNRRISRRLDERGIRTTARVVRSEEWGSLEGASGSTIWLEFADSTGTVRRVKQRRSSLHVVGDELEVVYDPENPGSSRSLRLDSDTGSLGCVHALFFVILGIPGLFFIVIGLLIAAGVVTQSDRP